MLSGQIAVSSVALGFVTLYLHSVAVITSFTLIISIESSRQRIVKEHGHNVMDYAVGFNRLSTLRFLTSLTERFICLQFNLTMTEPSTLVFVRDRKSVV